MNIQMTGLDHTRAPLEIREKFAFTTKMQLEIMQDLKSDNRILGVVMLCTCNRAELWVHAQDGYEPDLRKTICERVALSFQGECVRMQRRSGAQAVDYLFSMTAGLESQIFGEDQILTQVKEAAARARDALCTDAVLEVLFRMAVTGAKKAKSVMQTSMADTGAVGQSMATLQRGGYDFYGKRCLVIGNGKMGKIAAQALRAAGADVTVTVRQYRSGIVEIPAGCRRIDYGERLTLLPTCDLIVSATTSPNVTIRRAHLAQTGWKPGLVLLDLAVPRDLEPEIAELSGVQLYDIDAFPAPPSADLAQIRAEAEALLHAQEREFFTWYDCRDIIPATDTVATHFARDLRERIDLILQRQGVTENAQLLREAIELASGKQLKRILFTVRDEAGADAFRACLGAVEKLYET